MVSWEEEYQKQIAMEEERYRRQLAANARRRAHRKKVMTLFAVLALFIVATVVIVTVSLSGSGSTRDRDRHRDNETKGDETQDPGETEPQETEPKTPEPIVIPDWIEVNLLPVNDYSRPGIELPEVNGVVVHYVGNPNTTAKQNRSYFAGLAQSHATSASSHFIVGLEGEILLIVPLEEISYASNSRNYDTIAIEVCHPDATGKFNDATMESLVKLLKWLCETYDLDRDQVIRHYDVVGKICPKYYVEHPEAWEELRNMVFDT